MVKNDFDINQFVSDKPEPESKEVARYIERLMAFFEQSPEARTLLQEDQEADLWWAQAMLDYALNYIGVSPPEMSADDLRQVLYKLFPAKVSTPDGFDGKMVVGVLRAFWHFLKREYGLQSSEACLKVLDDKAPDRLNRAMNDPSLFGPAKSIIMMGAARGFDMSTEEGINEWILAYNQELTSSGAKSSTLQKGRARRKKDEERRKRKMAEASRKKNRRKR